VLVLVQPGMDWQPGHWGMDWLQVLRLERGLLLVRGPVLLGMD
jgi:hypothetical protein